MLLDRLESHIAKWSVISDRVSRVRVINRQSDISSRRVCFNSWQLEKEWMIKTSNRNDMRRRRRESLLNNSVNRDFLEFLLVQPHRQSFSHNSIDTDMPAHEFSRPQNVCIHICITPSLCKEIELDSLGGRWIECERRLEEIRRHWSFERKNKQRISSVSKETIKINLFPISTSFLLSKFSFSIKLLFSLKEFSKDTFWNVQIVVIFAPFALHQQNDEIFHRYTFWDLGWIA